MFGVDQAWTWFFFVCLSFSFKEVSKFWVGSIKRGEVGIWVPLAFSCFFFYAGGSELGGGCPKSRRGCLLAT